MRGLVLAAGLGTRLRPWTLHHPKALVPVEGVPVLERVLRRMEEAGCDEIVVNVHHFGEQIIDWLAARGSGRGRIIVSDERERLLDTGGGILRAFPLGSGRGPMLVHNADILSTAPLEAMMRAHVSADDSRAATLLTCPRQSARRLVFDAGGRLRGWVNKDTGELRPGGFRPCERDREMPFGGIYIMDERGYGALRRWAERQGRKVFGIMEFLLDSCSTLPVREYYSAQTRLLDIGKPDALAGAGAFLRGQ